MTLSSLFVASPDGYLTRRKTLLAFLEQEERDHIKQSGPPSPQLVPSTTRSWHAMTRLNRLKKS